MATTWVPPGWFIFLITWGLTFVVVAAVVTVVLIIHFTRGRQTFEHRGMRVYVDRELTNSQRVREDDLVRLVGLFEDGMCPDPWTRGEFARQLDGMKCYLRARKLTTDKRVERPTKQYNGLTHGPKHIEVACDQEFWNVRCVVVLGKTAFLYELLNACIWGLDEDGPYVAYAEKFLDPTDEAHWRWFKDIDGDKDVDESDVFAWKARREVYQKAFLERVRPYV